MKLALFNFASCRLHVSTLARVRFAPLRLASRRSTPKSFASVRLALSRSAPCRQELNRLARVRFAPMRLEFARFAPLSSVRLKSIPEKSRAKISALLRFGLILGFLALHLFQAATPRLTLLRCSWFATDSGPPHSRSRAKDSTETACSAKCAPSLSKPTCYGIPHELRNSSSGLYTRRRPPFADSRQLLQLRFVNALQEHFRKEPLNEP